jgi:putative transcriptional regulator
MKSMPEGVLCQQAEAYALGALEPSDATAYSAHLASCEGCRDAVAAHASALSRLAGNAAPDPALRQQVVDLAGAPDAERLELGSLRWDEVVPGVRLHVLREEPARGMRACLVWARPGARHPRHRHLGDEVILVLRGAVRDERGVYGPGQVCRSRAGSVHSEEAMPGEDCLCYVVYYGALEPLEPLEP